MVIHSAEAQHLVTLSFSDISVWCYGLVKFIYSEKATKILRNLPLTFDNSTYGQKLGEDFAKFCGLLRIYELYMNFTPIGRPVINEL